MADTGKKATRITYGRLNKVLTTLGFVRKQTEEFTAYHEARHGALIVLPNMKSSSDVGDPHLVTVRNTVVGKGVAPLDTFETLLIGPGSKHSGDDLQVPSPRRTISAIPPRKPRTKRLKPGSAAPGQQSARTKEAPTKAGAKRRCRV